MSDITEKLRQFAATRKQLGSQPCGYDFMIEAADWIKQHRETIGRLASENIELRKRVSELEAHVERLEAAINVAVEQHKNGGMAPATVYDLENLLCS